MSHRDPSAQENPPGQASPRGGTSNPNAPPILSLREGRGQPSHAAAASQAPPTTSGNPPSEQMTDGIPTHCFDKSELARYLGISVRTWDRATAARETPPPDLMVGRSPRWSPETIARWLKTKPRLPGRGGRT